MEVSQDLWIEPERVDAGDTKQRVLQEYFRHIEVDMRVRGSDGPPRFTEASCPLHGPFIPPH